MKTSDLGIDLIRRHEGLRLDAYLDPVGIPTIGFGHTRGVKIGQKISEKQALIYLKEDLCNAEKAINKLLLNINQNQFDALVSFVFNVGEAKFLESTLLRKIKNDPLDRSVRNEFIRWKNGRVGGELKPLPGLLKRRMDEANLYFHEST